MFDKDKFTFIDYFTFENEKGGALIFEFEEEMWRMVAPIEWHHHRYSSVVFQDVNKGKIIWSKTF